MPAAERRRIHDAWLRGDLDAVCVTSAFGMGIDKADVRTVVHADPPESLDEYLQEVGRAGRDGDAALAVVRGYAETLGCRRQLLLASFGETLEHPCGNCDRCDAGLAGADPVDQDESPFPVGGRVVRAAWGEVLVVRYEGDRVVTLFDSVGYRTLALQTVIDRGLLT